MTAFTGPHGGAGREFDDQLTVPLASSPVPNRRSDTEPRRASTRTKVLRGIVLLALIPITAFYLYPRIHDLTATPYRLDQAVVSANNYNPALAELVEHEKVTLSAFAALDKMRAALASVQETDATVAAELNTLIGQISGDVQNTLDQAGTNVDDLVASLDTLTAQINTLQPPVDGATAALTGNRATLASILDDARSTAEEVHNARVSAEESANDLSGK
ncbi:hypothetical protein CJ179_29240 [Rhodococcus sp. ACS1]|uniref:hypothetical protein n=1 Tax=Rhodococcus sp. ACS1 TaxID=2028570 RepID=UPI000BB10212|nr:hypothetical protein [Rhodococcus sp. ACS1]PBC44858.1 hypothetical protein CJ179_29240 [Rhodococcus sp. ACS1]